MLNFNPPELKDRLVKATKAWTDEFNLEYPDEAESFFPDICSDDFDPLLHEDAEVDASHLIKIYLPRCDEIATISCEQFISLVEELKEAELCENTMCRSSKRLVIRVETEDYESARFLYYALPEASSDQEREIQGKIIALRKRVQKLRSDLNSDQLSEEENARLLDLYQSEKQEEQELFSNIKDFGRNFFVQRFNADSASITCSLIKGFSLFGVKIAIEGAYEKYHPPVLNEDLFVEIKFDKSISKAIEENIFEAYLFELNSSLNIVIQKSPRAYIDDSWPDEDDEFIPDCRLRPLILGKGITELLSLYNKAVVAQDLSVQILYFTKAVEYVSQTVIRKQANTAIRSKLLSSRALNPDAEFIAELEAVVEGQRIYKKDRESIRQTIAECCDAGELSSKAPPFLKELRKVTVESNEQEVTKALGRLSQSLYATRNQIAHAKANYTLSGDECPTEELRAFTECIRVATQQVIHWYQFSHESMRLM